MPSSARDPFESCRSWNLPTLSFSFSKQLKAPMKSVESRCHHLSRPLTGHLAVARLATCSSHLPESYHRRRTPQARSLATSMVNPLTISTQKRSLAMAPPATVWQGQNGCEHFLTHNSPTSASTPHLLELDRPALHIAAYWDANGSNVLHYTCPSWRSLIV